MLSEEISLQKSLDDIGTPLLNSIWELVPPLGNHKREQSGLRLPCVQEHRRAGVFWTICKGFTVHAGRAKRALQQSRRDNHGLYQELGGILSQVWPDLCYVV